MNVKKLQFAVVIALIVFLSVSYFSYPLLGPDSGFYLATAREFYSGKVYFSEIAIAYNPLAIAILGLPFLFSESPDPRLSLLLNMIVIWMTAYVLYRILQKIKRNRSDNLLYALCFVLGGMMLDGSHLMLEPVSVFFQLCGLFSYLQHKSSEKATTLFLAGLAFCLSFLSKQYGLFILAPVGIDILLNKRNILRKIVVMGCGFTLPIGLFYLYLAANGMAFPDFIRHILGVGAKLDVGNGTGINFSLITYLTGFGVFLLYNLYVVLIPGLVLRLRKSIDWKNALPLTILPFSLLVLVSASYLHYFAYVLPYALIALVFLIHKTQADPKFKSMLMLVSLFFMMGATVFSYSRKQSKIDLQEETYSKLSAQIPKKSKVYLDGISPAYYYLCDFQSLRLDRLGFTFPGYFYPKTIVGLMEPHSYLVVSEGAFPSYKLLVAGFTVSKIRINGEVFFIIKKE